MAKQTVIKSQLNIEETVYGWGSNDDGDNLVITYPKPEEGLAKIIIHNHVIKADGPMIEYYAKIGSQGSDRGMLFNPNGMYSNYENRMESAYSSKYYTYRRVSIKCFNLYKLFLCTGSPVYLRNAQREI